MGNNLQTIRNIIALLLVVSIGLLSAHIWHLEREKREVKKDLVHLSEIRYGLFNVDEWKKIIVEVISKNIEEFDLNERDREAMKVKVTKFLNSLIDDFEKRYHQEEKHRSDGFLEQAKGAMRRALVSGSKLFEHMRQDIPVFTEEILDFVKDPENAKMLKGYLTEKLDEYAEATFAETDYTEYDRVVAKYSAESKTDAIGKMNERLTRLENAQQPYVALWYGLVFISLLLVFFVPMKGMVEHFSLLGLSLILLLLGLTLPMIEIDARIGSLSFHLLGEEVAFTDQVVYHKCKSILEVVRIMLKQDELKVVGVGFLVLLFSVIFPTLKLLSCVGYLLSDRFRKHKAVRFFVFRTGKWSMADVLVVAIFMSYIGFSGILNDQLGQLQRMATHLNLLATNNSTLMFGFYAFTGFVLMGLLLAYRLQKFDKQAETY